MQFRALFRLYAEYNWYALGRPVSCYSPTSCGLICFEGS